jgi:HSP20 family protein
MVNLLKRGAATPARTDGQTQSQTERFMEPRASVTERADEVWLELEMPGVERDKIEVTIERDELTITGYRRPESYENVEVLHQERLPANYRRSFVLGDQIDGSKISAQYESGVLRLVLPKAETAKPRKITIQ